MPNITINYHVLDESNLFGRIFDIVQAKDALSHFETGEMK